MTQIKFLEEEIHAIPNHEPFFGEEEQMAKSIACYLWDYLRRTGGADSAATASAIFHMCHQVYNTISAKDE